MAKVEQPKVEWVRERGWRMDEKEVDERPAVKRVQGPIDISGIKRCYVGMVVTIKCPGCDEIVKCDLERNYLGYPEVGGEDSLYFYCNPCEVELDLPIKIVSADLVLEYNPKDIITL